MHSLALLPCGGARQHYMFDRRASYLGRGRDAQWFTAGSQASLGTSDWHSFFLKHCLPYRGMSAHGTFRAYSSGSSATTVPVPLLPGPRGHCIVEDSPVTEFTGITVQHSGNALRVHCYSDIYASRHALKPSQRESTKFIRLIMTFDRQS